MKNFSEKHCLSSLINSFTSYKTGFSKISAGFYKEAKRHHSTIQRLEEILAKGYVDLLMYFTNTLSISYTGLIFDRNIDTWVIDFYLMHKLISNSYVKTDENILAYLAEQITNK